MISKLYNWLRKKDENIALGLASGLVFGLAVGLASGLVFGLVFDIFQGQFGIPIIPILIVFYLISEAVFLIQKRYFHKGKYSFWETLGRKAEAFFDVLLVGINILNIKWLIQNVEIDWIQLKPVTNFIGWGTLIIGGIIGIIYLNMWIANKLGKRCKK